MMLRLPSKKPYRCYWRTPFAYILLAVAIAMVCIMTSPCLAILATDLTAQQLAISSQTDVLTNQSTGQTLSQQGRSLYEAGQFSEAALMLQRAIQIYRVEGNALGEAVALRNLALVYQQLGEWDQAETVIQNSLDLLYKTTVPGSLEALAQAQEVQGRLFLETGQLNQALRSWEAATIIYTQLNDADGMTRSLINQADVLQNLGLYRRAYFNPFQNNPYLCLV
jgi:tetratricopeptide (TPR) repeat protein